MHALVARQGLALLGDGSRPGALPAGAPVTSAEHEREPAGTLWVRDQVKLRSRASRTRSDQPMKEGWSANVSRNAKLQALILADHIYHDASTGKKVIAGTFNAVHPEAFPSKLTRPTYAFISLTDVQGKLPLNLRFIDAKDLRVLIEAPFEVECKDPLQSVEVIVKMPPLPMPHPGVFTLELHSRQGECLGSLRITVEKSARRHG